MTHKEDTRDEQGARRDEQIFDSFSEAIAYANDKSSEAPRATTKSYEKKGFTGTFDYPEAHRYAVQGWAEGRAEVAKISSALLAHVDVAHYSSEQECTFDVVGNGGFDMGRVMEGTPECMIDWRESERLSNNTPRSGSKVVRIAFNASYSAGITTEVILRRGACVQALVDALELAGYSVEIIGFMMMAKEPLTSRKRTTPYAINQIPLKTAGESLQPDQMAFALAHPAMVRRVGFSILRSNGAFWHYEADNGSYGYPMPIPAQDARSFDVVLPEMTWSDNRWDSVESSTEYFRGVLAGFGVALQAREDVPD